jgi:hypothetical protein
MRALSERVHAGIGAARAMNAYRGAANSFKRLFEVILNGVAMLLTLPPGKVRPVVCDD